MDNIITGSVTRAHFGDLHTEKSSPLGFYDIVLLAVGLATTDYYNGNFWFLNIPEREGELDFIFEVQPFQKGFLRFRTYTEDIAGRQVIVDLRDVDAFEAARRLQKAAVESYYG